MCIVSRVAMRIVIIQGSMVVALGASCDEVFVRWCHLTWEPRHVLAALLAPLALTRVRCVPMRNEE